MNISHFGAYPNDNTDSTPAVRAALESLRGQKNAHLSFSAGRYDFYPDRAVEEYLFVSNNDESLKRLIFPISEVDGLEIDGEGAQFFFHGFCSPFAIQNSRNVRLSNFSIDWTRTFHAEAEVLAVGDGFVDLFVPAAFPYRVEYDQLVFTGEGDDVYRIGYALEFDPHRRETAFRVCDNYALRHGHRAESLGEGQVHLWATLATVPTPGNVLVLIDNRRLCPAIILAGCQNLVLENVTIHHCGGMGVIAQNCRDLRLERVDVVPSGERLISTIADATHFVNCGGHIQIENCRFENQLDDPVNIHGLYSQITQRISDTEIEVRLVHPQQLGVPIAAVGDEIGFVAKERLNTYATAKVSAVNRLNKTYTRLQFETALPAEVAPIHVIENHEWRPDVTIRGCTSRGNRARGFLLSTAGRVLIENNIFHTPGAAIFIAGDANYWFESGAVRDITIRDNLFDNCLYGRWGRAVIDINPEIEPELRSQAPFHRNITIENNHFRAFDARLLKAHCVDGLTVRNNEIEPTEDYPVEPLESEPFEIENCLRVHVEANRFLELAATNSSVFK